MERFRRSNSSETAGQEGSRHEQRAHAKTPRRKGHTLIIQQISPPRSSKVLRAAIVLPFVIATLAAVGANGEQVDYVRAVKPILAKRCYVCHGAWKQNGGLRLDTGASIRKGGETGPAAVADDVSASLLIGVITGTAGFRMPPENEGAPLSAAEIEIIKKWIEQGATSPVDEQPAVDPRTYWSYQRVRRPSAPTLAERSDWPRNPIDTFLAAKYAEHGVTPRPDATKEVLLRRVYLDLIGLPPTPDELHEFLADDRPDALHRVVDWLLTNPLYGQRWGRHWMDVWRYSDWYGSRAGNEMRYSQRHIWRWRDWIVDSLNADHGYDQMVIEMLAGDELAPGNPDIVRATGFLGRNWYKFDRNVWMFETVEQSCQAFLGLTMNCARCHDHKFDPITQRDYFRFRAFFEPHDVRTDPISVRLDTEKDATLGQVLKEGVSFVYDKQLDAPTYLFQRGDSRSPKQDEPLHPGIPAAFGTGDIEIQSISLPPTVVAPYLTEEVLAGLTEQSRRLIDVAERRVADANSAVHRAKQRLDEFVAGREKVELSAPNFDDHFDQPRPEIWKPIGGQWEYESGHVAQKQPGTFPTMLANVALPRDFAARLRYKTLEAGEIHSVGLFFDVTDLRDGQAIYTATNNTKASVQAFHRLQGTEHYPPAGIFPCQLRLQEEVTMDIAVRERQLNVWLNGELMLAYTMPTPRRDGSFALWTHSGAAEFHELRFHPLPTDFQLASGVAEKTRSPFEPSTLADLERQKQLAERAVLLAEKQGVVARAEGTSLEARIAADRAKVVTASNSDELAQAAGKAERSVAVAKSEYELLQAEQALEVARNAPAKDDATKQKAVADAETKLTAAQKEAEAARANLAKTDGKYAPLGAIYPSTSSGRRLALARWIANPENPRTSRIAVNHIWLRHFGEALVPTVANFGLNGRQPSHPELLDWLASELVDGHWSMKQLHRKLVTSATYRLASTEGPTDAVNLARDRENRWLWRMNSHRAESEVIRDSVLYVSGELDLAFGGPELPESAGLDSRRRSLYFRSTPNEKMAFLELFDQANPNECYRRQESVVPQQSLALFNSSVSLDAARKLATSIAADYPVSGPQADFARFIEAAYERILARSPRPAEIAACRHFLERHITLIQNSPRGAFPAANPRVTPAATQPLERATENLVHVLLNHNDFVTVR